MTINYLVVDDEPLARARVKRMMSDHQGFSCVGEAGSAAEAEALLERHSAALVFIDISMPGQDGVSFAQQLRQRFPRMKLVFLTAHPEFALQAFELHANGYLVKPLAADKLATLLTTIFPTSELIGYQVGSELRQLQLDSVVVAQADGKYSKLTLGCGKKVLVDHSLKNLLEKYPNYFVQVHRSTLVKRKAIQALDSKGQQHYVKLAGMTEQFEVSRRAFKELKQALSY